MSSSRCLVSKLRELSLGKPHSTRCPGNMPQATGTQPHLPWPTPRWWFLLWGVLQAFPTQGSVVLLAQWLPQKLTSPGYPEPYVKGQESSTDIEAPEGYVVRLLFQDFDLEPSPDCERDSVTLTASGMDLGQFCGQQGSLLGRPPGQKEFVSSGNSLRLTFSAPASEDKTPGFHKGFLALYQAVAVNYTQPINQATGGPKAIPTPGDNPTEIQSCCQEPYYEAKPSGTLTCTAQVPWKQTQKREEAPRCVPADKGTDHVVGHVMDQPCQQIHSLALIYKPASETLQPGSTWPLQCSCSQTTFSDDLLTASQGAAPGPGKAPGTLNSRTTWHVVS